MDGPAPFDEKRSLGGAAIAPGEGAHQGNGGVGGGGDDLAHPSPYLAASACFAVSTIALKPAASRTARSASILRSTATPASDNPFMKREYGRPFSRDAALMRTIQRRRMSRLRVRLSRY